MKCVLSQTAPNAFYLTCLCSIIDNQNSSTEYIDLSSPTNFQTQVQVVSSNSTEISVSEHEEEDIPFVVVWAIQAVAFDMALNDGKTTMAIAEKIGPYAVTAVEWIKDLSDGIRHIIEKISKFIYNDIYKFDDKHQFVKDVINGGIIRLVVSCDMFLLFIKLFKPLYN